MWNCCVKVCILSFDGINALVDFIKGSFTIKAFIYESLS